MLNLAIGLSVDTFHPCQLQQPLQYLLVDQLYAKEVYCCSFVTKSNQASTKYLLMYSTVSIGLLHMEENPAGFSQALPLMQHFPMFYYGTSSFCCLHIFFIAALQTSKGYTRSQ